MLKKLFGKYLRLISNIPERHYWPLFIFLSLYFVVPYSEFVVTLIALSYFKFEKTYRKLFAKIVSPLPDFIKYGGSLIFFLVMLDDTLMYASVIAIAYWSSRKAKKSLPSDEDDARLSE
tara:strand:- start:229 stop:585 length:357 start_codon:yes stop_codon:yes gene_type:complete